MASPRVQRVINFSILAASHWISPALALTRSLGPPDDYRFKGASNACDGRNPKNFEFGLCSIAIACTFGHLDEAFKASLASGTNIASLLPTILVLIGKSGHPRLPIHLLKRYRCSVRELVVPCP